MQHKDPAWGAYRVLDQPSQSMYPTLKEALPPRGRCTALPRDEGHKISMPWGKGAFKGREMEREDPICLRPHRVPYTARTRLLPRFQQ
jgi:hypothetical protein